MKKSKSLAVTYWLFVLFSLHVCKLTMKRPWTLVMLSMCVTLNPRLNKLYPVRCQHGISSLNFISVWLLVHRWISGYNIPTCIYRTTDHPPPLKKIGGEGSGMKSIHLKSLGWLSIFGKCIHDLRLGFTWDQCIVWGKKTKSSQNLFTCLLDWFVAKV